MTDRASRAKWNPLRLRRYFLRARAVGSVTHVRTTYTGIDRYPERTTDWRAAAGDGVEGARLGEGRLKGV